MVPIGRYRHGPDTAPMAFERAQCLAGLQVPEPQRSVIRGRDGAVPIRHYRHGADPAPMAFERADQRTAWCRLLDARSTHAYGHSSGSTLIRNRGC
jgi:hypothetical protein